MLELVATIPSIPFVAVVLVAGVLVALDIDSRSGDQLLLPSHARQGTGSATFFYTPEGGYLPSDGGTWRCHK
jgi:hypothetical protein